MWNLRELGLSDLGAQQLDELLNRVLPRLSPQEVPLPSGGQTAWRTSHISTHSFFYNKHGESEHVFINHLDTSVQLTKLCLEVVLMSSYHQFCIAINPGLHTGCYMTGLYNWRFKNGVPSDLVKLDFYHQNWPSVSKWPADQANKAFTKYFWELMVLSCPLFTDFSCGALPMSALLFSRQHSPLQTVSTEIKHWPGNKD